MKLPQIKASCPPQDARFESRTQHILMMRKLKTKLEVTSSDTVNHGTSTNQSILSTSEMSKRRKYTQIVE
ncbi:hypothetical protein CEXT_570091 [Caerostris extrusa]|uniref:Uncharacterized protein n=1 Tax=Caerostris extrusa TaxID=172846 RepID=A0AAV4P956_CAEEX|nr:hypothetical protein CEXT_570091 [Caerostris extrusa]